MADLGIPQNTIKILQKYNFNFQKRFGQNFLIDTNVLKRIIAAADVTKEDYVLEIGPGIGTMTQYLAEAAGRVTAVIPYFGYARQDRKAKARDPISAKLVANMLTAAGADRVLTMDLHAAQIQGFFDIPVDNLYGNPVFVDYYAKKFGEKCEEMVVVSPDVGSVSRARAFAQKLHMNLAIVDKRRQKANQCEVMNVIGDVEGKDCILFDDMVDTAGSLCNAAKAIVEVGGAKNVYACASHGVLSGPAIGRINESVITELAFLDTIAPIDPALSSKIKYLTVAPMFAEAIERIYQEISVSKLWI